MAKSKRKGVVRGQLTSEELDRNLPKPGEGFSIRTTGPGVGRPARNALSVGFAPDRGRADEVTIIADRSIKSQMKEFNESNLDLLGTPGASMAQGGWANPDTGEVEQDRSILLPRTPEGTSAAMHIGVQSGQAGIGNLGYRKYLGDIDIPHYLNKDQYQGPKGYNPSVEDLGVSEETGRRRVRITPGLQEAIGVEAGEIARNKRFKAKPFKEKGAAQYVKESLSHFRKNRGMEESEPEA